MRDITRYRAITICLCALIFITSFATAQQTDGPADGELLRTQVLGLTSISLVSNLATIVEIGFVDEQQMANFDFPWWLYGTVGTHHVPLYALDAGLALSYTISDALLVGAHLATAQWPLLTSVPFNLFAYNEFYSTYDIYRAARGRAAAGVYPEEWETYSRVDLALAPIDRQNLTDPLFLATVLTTTVLQVISAAKSDEAIWATGETWVDGKQLPPVAAIPYVVAANWLRFTATAVGEEALYRGVVYEELRTSFGPAWAKVADMFIFSAIHIPTDIARGKTLANIGIQFGIRFASTLLFDFAYDRGGLPLSTAIHTWFNFVAQTAQWAKTGGVQNP